MHACDRWLKAYYGSLSLRDFTVLDRAARTLLGNILVPEKNSKLPWDPYRGISPSHIGFRGIWNWDTAFHAVGVARWDTELAREQILMFLNFQLESGALPDVIFEDGRIVDDFGKPPLMPWAAMIVEQSCPDIDFVKKIYPAFEKYEKFWMEARGGNRRGLFNYDCSFPEPGERLNRARCESGWDNAVRWDDGIYELWPVDLNCFMVMLYRAMSYFAGRLGLAGDQRQWQRRENALSALIEANLWDPVSSSYLDYDFAGRRFGSALSPASFMPLYVGIASSGHAASMAEKAASSEHFYPGWPTVSYSHKDFDPEGYWRGRTWLNVAYFALKGLKNYGFDAIADAGRDILLARVAENPDFIYENYHPVTGKGLGVRNFSWSAVFAAEFILNWTQESLS